MEENQHYSSPDQVPGKGKSTASLVLGILSIVLCWTSWVGMILGILAIVFGVLAKRTLPADAAKLGRIGFILGIIGLILSVILLIVLLSLGAAVMSAYGGVYGY
ncbi:MAG: hypothetical protein LUG13_10235 [Oscillospiraceae bacterium]|nr:hypothetical protein [Oscillospiraceae bacterium]